MTYALPGSYDAWRTAGPDEQDYHPGPHRNALTIEAGEVTIDAWGWYDGDGVLESVQIDGKHIKPEAVQAALDLLGHADHTTWADPLDDDALAELSCAAFEADTEARAEYRAAVLDAAP